MPDTFSSIFHRVINALCPKSTLAVCIVALSTHFAMPVAGIFAFSAAAAAQDTLKSDLNVATLMGTVLDTNGDTVPNASVTALGLNGPDSSRFETADNGLFQSHTCGRGSRIKSRS